MKKVVLMLGAAMALVGCSKTEQIVNGDSNQTVELSGSIIDTGKTRGDGPVLGTLPENSLAIDVFRADATTGSYSADQWNLKVAGYLAHSGKISLSPIQRWLDDEPSKFIGVYPTGGVYEQAARTITFDLDGAKDVMISDAAYGDIGGLDATHHTLDFTHLLTKIEVVLKAKATKKVNGDDVFDPERTEEVINRWGKIKSVEVDNKKVKAMLTLPAPNGTGGPAIVPLDDPEAAPMPLTDAAGKAPAVDFLQADPGDATYGYAMFLPSDASETLSLIITFEDGTAEGTAVIVPTTQQQQYVAGYAYKITVVFEANKATVEAVDLQGAFTDWDFQEDVTLDGKNSVDPVTPQEATTTLDGLSNAYILAPTEQTLKFKVARAYKYTEGSGFGSELRVDNDTYTGEFTAEVIWSEPTGLFKIDPTVVGSGKNAIVTVVTNNSSTSGNAVVAIKKKDTSNIVWSYHIWVTDYLPTPDNTYTNVGGANDPTFMDRNLGATTTELTSIDARGLFYQWGRKDPFPTTGEVAAVVNAGTIEEAIAAPTTFFKGTATGVDWLTTEDKELWGHGVRKSFYDPCPSGWRVPFHGGLPATAANSPWAGFDTAEKTWTDDVNNGLTFTVSGVKYPAGGVRLSATGVVNQANQYGYAWTASPLDETSRVSSILQFSSSVLNLATTGQRSLGLPVRCIKE
jgi:hypothetical protein